MRSDAAVDVLKDNPNNLVALSAIVGYVYALVPYQAALTPPMTADLDVAEKAATQILDNPGRDLCQGEPSAGDDATPMRRRPSRS